MSLPLKFRVLSVIALQAAMITAAASQSPVQMDGAPNFRDIGGYKTADGHTVKSARIYRSGQLSELTAEDLMKLDGLGIRYVFDLRSSRERTVAPTLWQGERPKFIEIPLGDISRGTSAPSAPALPATASAEQARAVMGKLTSQIALTGAEDIGKIMQDLATGDEPAVIHCTAGKDRTGVTVAVLLTVLGVPRDVVLTDYARSNAAMKIELTRRSQGKGMFARGASDALPKDNTEAMKAGLAADPAYLEATFRAIDERYGSFENYVRDGLHLDAAQVKGLKMRMLQP